jgi:hypothetical protein
MRPAALVAAGLAAALALAAPRAVAQPAADVPALIKLIENQPEGTDRTAWKESRRDAARKLVASKDKRAVPELIKLAETETFDIIGEIAIEGLGTLGDKSAVPTLQKIVADNSRDRSQRDLAKKALAKLGAPESGGAGNTGGTGGDGGTGTGDTGTGDTGDTGTGLETGLETGTGDAGTDTGSSTDGGGLGSLVGTRTGDLPVGPALPDDTIAAYDRLTFAVGGAHLRYDSTRNLTTLDADVAGRYQRRIERERMAWGLDGSAHVVTGFVNPEGGDTSKGAVVDVRAAGEARFYAGKIYGIGQAVAALDTTYISTAGGTRDVRNAADFQIALGGGFGRMLDVGAALRVRRISTVLDRARALGRPIDASLARRLQLTWWALRGDKSAWRMLTATVAILREAGVLLGEPDAGLTYELLEVLRDGQLDRRTAGFDAYLAISESYLLREEDTGAPDGRYEQALARVAYAKQLPGETSEITGEAYARYRLFAGDGDNTPWGLGASARWRKFTYGEHFDPLVALDVGAHLAVDDPDVDGVDLGFLVGGDVGLTLRPNRASALRLAGNLVFDRGEMILGATLEATYGLGDGSVSRY